MSKTRSFNYRLTRLFPANDEYAATIACLCILWEDFVTEATGGAAESVPQMDGHSAQWRRQYFLRRSIGTLHEIRKALHQLRLQPEFKLALARQSKDEQVNFKKSFMTLIRHEGRIKSLRDSIAGGHVLQKSVKASLSRIDQETLGMIQHGTYYKDIRYKLVHPIVLRAVFTELGEEEDNMKVINEFMDFLHEATSNALKIIEFVFHVYVKERGVTPL